MTPSRVHGQYALYDTLGTGAAASVHLGVSRGATVVPVAIKRLHDGNSRDAAAVNRLLDEVRLTRHVVHPNVVRVLDFVSDGEEMLEVMEYVHGEPLSRLLASARERRGGGPSDGPAVPLPIARTIIVDLLRGLHAAHEAKDAEGRPLGIVHRDVTPENVLVGADGVSRLMDFGVAKAEGRLHATRDGGVRGKIAYLAPEQVGGEVTRRSDLYAVGLVSWEMLVGKRAIDGDNEAAILVQALDPKIERPGARISGVPRELDDAIMHALCTDPEARFATAAELAGALEHAPGDVADHAAVGEWVRALASERLGERDARLEAIMAAEGAMASASAPHPIAQPAPSEARPLVGMVVMGAAALLVVVVGLAFRAGDQPPTAVDPVGPSATFTGVVVQMSATSTASVASTAPIESSPPRTAEPGPSALPLASASARARLVRPPQAKCDPPWVLDSKGIRRYDPACVR